MTTRGVAWTKEVEQHLQFAAPVPAGAGYLLRAAPPRDARSIETLRETRLSQALAGA